MLLNQNNVIYTSREKARVLSDFMSAVYAWMMVGLCISGITAYYIATKTSILQYLLKHSIVFYALIGLQLFSVIAINSIVRFMSVRMTGFYFAFYATLTGVTLSIIFLIYSANTISYAFFSTAFAFAGLSFIGYTTKRDLGPIGSFCMMALFGLIGISLLSFFIPALMKSSMQLIISALGIVIFSGLTAYDTQRIKALRNQYLITDDARKGAIQCALILYLDFINLFLNILRLMDRR